MSTPFPLSPDDDPPERPGDVQPPEVPPPPPDDEDLDRLFDRYLTGDQDALWLLVAQVYEPFNQLARRMLRRYPVLRSEVDTGDLLHQGMKRFLVALPKVVLVSLTHFRRFTAVQIRRELIDLARKVQARGHWPVADPDAVLRRLPARGVEPSTLSGWTELHEKIGQLPDKFLAVVDLHFYQELKLEEVATALGTTLDTVIGRWRKAKLLLRRLGPREDPA